MIGVCKETADNEYRVALTPEGVKKLKDTGQDIVIEAGAGEASSYSDDDYTEAGATTEKNRDKILSDCDMLLAVHAPATDDLKKMKKGSVLVSFIWPLQNEDYVDVLKQQQISGLAMDTVPRISRAQSMDALSSMSNIAGYKAALIGANTLDKYLPMMMTAAGTIPPAKVIVLGAGVAGLQAIATARRLGAVVEASDVRAAAKEEVMSLGAKFIEVEGATDDTGAGGYAVEQSEDFKERQQALVQEKAANADVIITTAQLRGKPAPILIPNDTIEKMKTGSVIVDMASSTGGNCEPSVDGQTVESAGVQIVGDSNLAAQMPVNASALFSKNIYNLLKHLTDAEGSF